MKPRNEGAAWDLTPDTYEMVNEPGGERSDHMDLPCCNPACWPETAMGHDLCGGAKVVMADDQLPPSTLEGWPIEVPTEARLDDMRVKVTPDADYHRLSHGLPITPSDWGVPVKNTSHGRNNKNG